ncbi:hypothetical protein DFR49_3479 [Hephaestia caeni]|uniref:Uncharacterized protein n=1 Tax=Hephaestia caeni TaxID=645617 RepID=A0A397NJ89_9SPHN|nr:hypothetical protein DFR49_3479 [Hephaestia caeni]
MGRHRFHANGIPSPQRRLGSTSVSIKRHDSAFSLTGMDASLRWHDGYFFNAACAAASRAIGTRYGDALT